MTIKPPAAGAQNMRTFYIIWFGQLVSLLGSGLTGFAMGVYVYQETGSITSFAMSILAFTVPGVLFSPIAGALVDRFPRRWMMILSDFGAGLTTIAILALFLSGSLEIWHIYVANFVASLFGTFQWPAYSAATTMLVPQEQLGRASGMVQMADAISQLAAPAIAGALFLTWGIPNIIMIDILTFLFAVGTLLYVRIPEPVRTEQEAATKPSIMSSVRTGFSYIRQRPGLFQLLMYFAGINLFFTMLQPLWTPLLLDLGTPAQAGLVGSIVGAGMLVGTFVMSAWGGPKQRVLGVLGTGLWMGVILIFLLLPASMTLIAVTGFFSMLVLPIMNGSSQALWQSKTEPDLQGRVFSVRRMLAQFTAPIAILLSGPLVDRVFGPALMPGGVLADTLIGQLVGVGPGRGMALFFAVIGLLVLVITVIALGSPRLRKVQDEIPDVIVKSQSEEDSLKEALGSS
ncbi:MAG TPA: MFS transporter [Anaerolineales bacterium]|nr:MFS transporter [Anaerolineales bacterium]HRQ92122.1 MFS transporter [Anaerolineales bacterium]